MKTTMNPTVRTSKTDVCHSRPHRLPFGVVFALLLTILGSCFLPIRSNAQTSYGSAVGTITDTAGAAVPGANVVLKNNGTGARQTATSNATGGYTFVNLTPGNYSVTASHVGFKTALSASVDVQIGGTSRVDLTLSVGDQTETVTVTAAPPDLHTDSATLDGVVEGRQVQEAPLNGRNVNNLLDFVPGVVAGGGTSGNTMANGGSGNGNAGAQTQAIAYGNYQIGGGFSGQSLFFIDGVGSNIPENNVNALVPTQDVIQEFRVSTSNVSAEFGGYGGGVIQMSTKSGTNSYHATAYEYLRNTALDADNWFDKYNGLAKQVLHQNQYGANGGGPLLKDKVFFFFSWEHESLTSTSPLSSVIPTQAELNGDFSSTPSSVGNSIYNPFTGKTGTSIAGNIDAAALAIIKAEMPRDSSGNLIYGTSAGVTNYHASAPVLGYQSQYNARVDANLGASDNLFARYTYWNPHNGISDPMNNLTGAGPTGNTTQEGVLGDNHTFAPTTVGEIRLSYLENYNFQDQLSRGYNMSSINSNYGAIQTQSGYGLLPALSIQNYAGLSAENSCLYWNNNVWAISGSITKIKGRHTIKGGGNWRQALWTSYSNNGDLTLTAIPTPATGVAIGNALAAFLLGIPSSTSTSLQGTQHAFMHTYGFYVTDTYQVTPKLMVTAGLRWDQPGAYSEENDNNTILQPNAAISIGSLNSFTDPAGSSRALTGQMALVNSSAYAGRREEDLHWNLFNPRLGFAYRLNDKTVIRAGYGISYFPADITQDGPQLSPIQRSSTTNGQSYTAPTSGLATQSNFAVTIANPMPNGVTQPYGRNQSKLTSSSLGNGLWARLPHQAYGYGQQWNLALERALDSKSTATVAYAGAKGTHLVIASAYTASAFQLNQIPDTYLNSMTLDQLTTKVVNPFAGLLPNSTVMNGSTVAAGQLLRPYPQYPNGVMQQVPRVGSSTYHALQASYIRHFDRGGILQVAYTWSKLLSNTDNTSAFLDGEGNTGIPQDNYNLKAEKSLSMQSLGQNLVANYGIDLPIGKGGLYLNNIGSGVNQIIGGWRVNGITTIHSGLPIALTAPTNGYSAFGTGTSSWGNGYANGTIRPNYAEGCSKDGIGSSHSKARVNAWFNTSCFTAPTGPFGNEPRVDSSIKSQGAVNFDFSLNKSFILVKEAKLKFAAETFNLFNHAQFAAPGTSNQQVGSGSFGEVTSTSNIPRTIQLSLRLTY